MRWMLCCSAIVSCASTSAANTFLDFFNAPLFLPFFLFVLIIGITGTIGCMSNVGGGTFLLVLLSQTGIVGDCVAGSGASWLVQCCPVCTCSSMSLKGVLCCVFR